MAALLQFFVSTVKSLCWSISIAVTLQLHRNARTQAIADIAMITVFIIIVAVPHCRRHINAHSKSARHKLSPTRFAYRRWTRQKQYQSNTHHFQINFALTLFRWVLFFAQSAICDVRIYRIEWTMVWKQIMWTVNCYCFTFSHIKRNVYMNKYVDLVFRKLSHVCVRQFFRLFQTDWFAICFLKLISVYNII